MGKEYVDCRESLKKACEEQLQYEMFTELIFLVTASSNYPVVVIVTSDRTALCILSGRMFIKPCPCHYVYAVFRSSQKADLETGGF